jgi:Transcriptional regulator
MKRDPYDVLDLKALRCFFFVAKHASVTRAATELGIAGPAVTQRVQQLEQDLGVKLYESRGGRVRLTPAGEHALSFASSLFDEIEHFERSLKQSEESGEIVVSAHDAILGYLLADRSRNSSARIRWPDGGCVSGGATRQSAKSG